MSEQETQSLVVQLSGALLKRDYNSFLSDFLPDAVFEVPFGMEGNVILNGIEAIREHFNHIGQSPLQSILDIRQIETSHYYDQDQDTLIVEYFIEGTNRRNENEFKIQSSLAIIQLVEGKIKKYKDFPNSIGLAKTAGILAQVAATIVGEQV